MRRSLLSLIAILLVVVVVLVGMQQWRSWRLDRSLAQASTTVAAVREAASAVEYKSGGNGCSPKDPKLYAAWRDSILDAYDALTVLRSVHGPGSPHLQALIRQLTTISEDVSLIKVSCEDTETALKKYAALIRKQKKARAELVVRKRRETIARKKRMEEALVERQIKETKGLNKARMTVEAVVKRVALVVFSPDSSSSFCQGQEPAYSKYLVLEQAVVAFLSHPPSATSQDEVSEWREKLLKARNTKEDKRAACTNSLHKRQ